MPKGLLVTRIALIANGIGMMLIYPLNMLVLERASWVWDYPSRHPAFEHMLVAIYVSMGAFLIWAARDPLPLPSLHRFRDRVRRHSRHRYGNRCLESSRHGEPSGVPGRCHGHLLRAGHTRADAPTLLLPVQAEDGMNSERGELATRMAARTVLAALLLAMMLQYLVLSREDRENFWLTGSLCARSPAPAR
jgi:hypothetical protein